MLSQAADAKTLQRIRALLAVVVFGLLVSGITAFPLDREVRILVEHLGPGSPFGGRFPEMAAWLSRVNEGLMEVSERHPFLFYGTDWLAFVHVVLAIAFWGPIRDPVRNRWVIRFGMIACALVPALALVAGPIRGIPLFWRLIDCSFGVFGFVPLFLADRLTVRLERTRGRGEVAEGSGVGVIRGGSPIVPTLRCRILRRSIAFYTEVLDFRIAPRSGHDEDPGFCVLLREGSLLFLSSHSGDGAFGQAVVVTTNDVDALVRKFRARGLETPGDPDAPTEVHEGPIDQTWGTRELYVDDPDGHTIRFTQGIETWPELATNDASPSTRPPNRRWNFP